MEGPETDKRKVADMVAGIAMISAFLVHGYCYWAYLNKGEVIFMGKKMYYISMYACLSMASFGLYLMARTKQLAVPTAFCFFAANSFLMVEFFGNPENWGTWDYMGFYSTLLMNCFSLYALHEVKKNILKK